MLNRWVKARYIPSDIVHHVNKGLVPHGVECLRFGGRAVQVVLVGVYRHVRVYRLVVCNDISYLQRYTNTHFSKHTTPYCCAQIQENTAMLVFVFNGIRQWRSLTMYCSRFQGLPGFPKVMLCRFWKSVGLRPVASQIRTRTVPLNMMPPPSELYHRDRAATRSLPLSKSTLNHWRCFILRQKLNQSLDIDEIRHGWNFISLWFFVRFPEKSFHVDCGFRAIAHWSFGREN